MPLVLIVSTASIQPCLVGVEDGHAIRVLAPSEVSPPVVEEDVSFASCCRGVLAIKLCKISAELAEIYLLHVHAVNGLSTGLALSAHFHAPFQCRCNVGERLAKAYYDSMDGITQHKRMPGGVPVNVDAPV